MQSRTNYYIAHVIWATHEEKVKLTLLESLKEGECIIIMDWKMKFLPQKHRESMQEYFGKAGTTWHGIYLLFKRNGVYTTKFYNDVGDDKEEDGFAVWSSFVDRCKILTKNSSVFVILIFYRMVLVAAVGLIMQYIWLLMAQLLVLTR